MAEIARRILQFNLQNGKHCICELPPGDYMGNVSALLLELETPIDDNCTLSLILCLWHYNRNNVEVGAFRSELVNLRGNVWSTVTFTANVVTPLDRLDTFLQYCCSSMEQSA